MSRTTTLGLIALVLAAVAFALAFVPGIEISAEIGVLLLVGAVTLLLAYERYLRARSADRSLASVESVEELPDVPTPGDQFEDGWDTYRFESLAVAAVAEQEGCSTDEATQLLETGEWTENPYAAAYFSSQSAADIPVKSGLLSFLRARPTQDDLQRHAVVELAEAVDIDAGDVQ